MCHKPKPLGCKPSIFHIAKILARRLLVDLGLDLGPCWQWQGYCTPEGYGEVRIGGRVCYVHRVAYAFFKGALPRVKVVGHRCNNSGCFNPSHLEAIHDSDNVAERNSRIAADNIPF